MGSGEAKLVNNERADYKLILHLLEDHCGVSLEAS
jgi:hypothetical protein